MYLILFSVMIDTNQFDKHRLFLIKSEFFS